MKKIISLFMLFSIAFALFSGCGARNAAERQPGQELAPEQPKLRIVATIFPEYDWVRAIIGEREDIELTLLLQGGTDLHSYQPSVDDILKISNCDMFIYTGGESSAWVFDALKNVKNDNLVVINLLEVLGDAVVAEEIIEGMEHDHDHEEDHDHDHKDGEEHDHENHDENEHSTTPDEHIWLSLRNAKTLCGHLSQALSELDSENAEFYAANAADYIAKLSALDEKYMQVVSDAKCSTLLFADRFPFRYLVEDYSLSYFAAFAGCSAETEASFETVIFLAGRLDELSLSHIMIIDNSGSALAATVSQSSHGKNQDILSLSSMQAVSAADISAGTTYLSIMEDNLIVLETALN